MTNWVLNSYFNPFHPQHNIKVENVQNFLKWTITKFLNKSNLKWDELLSFTCYCYNIFPGNNDTKYSFFLMFGWDPAKGCLSRINKSNRCYGTNEGKMVLEELHKLWKHHTNHFNEMHKNEQMDHQIVIIT